MTSINKFNQIKITLANPDQIKNWSYGEVKKAETISFRTHKPEKDGLFDERIFGPIKDFECSCGKYKNRRFKGIVCEKCGVEITSAKVRRDRMGHIDLVTPIAHIWFTKSAGGKMASLIGIPQKYLESIIYYSNYVITNVDDGARSELLGEYQKELKEELVQIESIKKDKEKIFRDKIADLQKGSNSKMAVTKEIQNLNKRIDEIDSSTQKIIGKINLSFDIFKHMNFGTIIEDTIDEFGNLVFGTDIFKELTKRYHECFSGSIGAEAVKIMLDNLDMDKELAEAKAELQDQIEKSATSPKIKSLLTRVETLSSFIKNDIAPSSMIMDVVPVLPPELRPIVNLDGGRFATSDLNDLYRRVINRNNRLKKLLESDTIDIVVNNEKRMLQEAEDALFDNGKRGRIVTGTNGRPLKSLSEILKGKQGRFRQNLLGKRVDYSGRSVIVVGPELKLHQCGLPKKMALELFKPYIEHALIDMGYANSPRIASKFIESQYVEVWDILEKVIREHPILLNRAPTLHRLGIQAFEPVLIEGKAMQLHPLVCAAFNADFDGDQMAVHLPLSFEAQAEARLLMLASNNIRKPSDGSIISLPSQDMIIGLYFLTFTKDDLTKIKPEDAKSFSSVDEVLQAFDMGYIEIATPIRIKLGDSYGKSDSNQTIITTYGRLLFNDALPKDYRFINETVDKSKLGSLIDDIANNSDIVVVDAVLDALKATGFKWATRSGVSIAFSDIITPEKQQDTIAGYEKEALKITGDFEDGFITDMERRSQLTDLWTKCTDEVADNMKVEFEAATTNTINKMVVSGARGNWMQIRQIAGMRGLVANPKGEIIPRPIKSNYHDGLSVLEYFIASHGARKGLADTALRTADSGYLTRRLVDVAQDVIIRQIDCATKANIVLQVQESEINDKTILGRVLSKDAVAGKDVVVTAGELIGATELAKIEAAGVKEVAVRSVLTCDAEIGVCAKCYGRSMSTSDIVVVGESVGVVAAQSIGEPGTQLTMRTFHTGGVASAADITQGLPRVEQVFELRDTLANENIVFEKDGTLTIEDATNSDFIVTFVDDLGKSKAKYRYPMVLMSKLNFKDGDTVKAGDFLFSDGPVNPKKILEAIGAKEAQRYIIDEIQKVYSSQGVDIHDKHIEVIARQMLRKIRIITSGDTEFAITNEVDIKTFEKVNRAAVAAGKKPASGKLILQGISATGVTSESWLSSASFKETTKSLTNAAIEGKIDHLVGLKENVIIGRRIPAGTGINDSVHYATKPSAEALAQLGEKVQAEREAESMVSIDELFAE